MNTPKTTVVYHSGDFDGIFCREIARRHFGDKAEYIGWNFGDAPLPYASPDRGNFVVLDLPCDQPFGQKFSAEAGFHDQEKGWGHFTWIDHHKSAIESHPKNIPGYRIDGVAACRLAWQWFNAGISPNPPWFYDKVAFVERRVGEPLAVRLAGEYDIWDKRDPDADTFQYALRVSPLNDQIWRELLDMSINETLQVQESQIMVQTLLKNGRAAQSYAQQENESLVKTRSSLIQWEGLTFLALNTARCNSLTFDALDTPTNGHDALMGFYWTSKGWTVSLYHAKHRTDLDLSKIAVKYGGGGHRGACGFTCAFPPFVTR